ncbi:hypothetical protein LLG46_05795 [bacterium]|nr:hypothetical protein [bacterium]
METQWIPADEVKQFAAEHGVSEWQRERWQKSALIPQSHVIPLGKGKGTCSEYPACAMRQMLATKRKLDRKRSFSQARLELWLEGYSIPTDKLKADLKKLVLGLLETLQQPGNDALDNAENLTAKALPSFRRTELGKSMKKRLKRAAEVESVITAIFQLVFGGCPVFSRNYSDTDELGLAQTFPTGMGIDWMEKTKIPEVGRWMPDMQENLVELAKKKHISVSALVKALDEAAEQELERARSDFLAIFGALPNLNDGLKKQDLPGMPIIEHIELDSFGLCIGALFMLRLRKSGLGCNIDEVVENARKMNAKRESGTHNAE